MMLKAFPSSQSTITADSPRVYLFAVEDMPLEALKRACRAFVKGDIAGRNHSFAPSAPELAQVAKEFEGKIRVEQFYAENQFVLEDSPLWKKLILHRQEDSFPTYMRDGQRGWPFPKTEIEQAEKLALPSPPSEAQQQINAVRAKQLIARAGTKFSVGDPEGDAEVA